MTREQAINWLQRLNDKVALGAYVLHSEERQAIRVALDALKAEPAQVENRDRRLCEECADSGQCSTPWVCKSGAHERHGGRESLVPAAPSIASHDGSGTTETVPVRVELLTHLRDYVNWFGAAHVSSCPKDDTCDCLCKPMNDAVDSILGEAFDAQVGSVPDSSSAKQAVERAGAQREDHSNTLATSSLSEAIPVGQQNKDDARLAPASASRLESDQRDDQTPSPQPEKGWEDVDGENADYVNRITAVVREADRVFENVGGGSRHWVRDVFLPLLNRSGLYIATEETCQHCGEDIRKDNDGDWLDRETHTTCDTPEGRKHTPQFGSATKATQAEPAASTGRSEAQKSQPHSDAERSSPAGLNLMERDAVLKEVETRIRIAERQGWTNRSVPIRLLKQIAALLPSSGSQE